MAAHPRRREIEPYRILFPIGTLGGLMGATSWISFATITPDLYPGELHSRLMTGGFLHVFAAGFLLTSIPRITGSRTASASETLASALLALVVIHVALVGDASGYFTCALAFMVTLGLFFVRRFIARTHQVYFILLYVALGISSGILGAGTLLLGVSLELSEPVLALARLLYYRAAILFLVVGIGGRMVPTFLGWPVAQGRSTETAPETVRFLNGVFIQTSLALLIAVSFGVEVFFSAPPGRLLLAFSVTLIFFPGWRLYSLPKLRTPMSLSFWTTGWAILIGLWAHALFPALSPHGLHIAFISGFGLLTLLMATRVTLTHGGFGTTAENRKAWALLSIVILLATSLRVLSVSQPEHYFSILALAAAAWTLALTLSALFLLPKWLFVKTPTGAEKPSPTRAR